MQPMNSLERVRAVLSGRIPDRIPVGLHNYLMACRMAENEVLQATRRIVAETAGRVFINGRADQGPVALALALCGPERFLTWVGEPESRPAVHRLLDICSRMNIAFGEAQIRAGAHSSTIGLAGHSLISPAMFDELELPRARAFCEALAR